MGSYDKVMVICPHCCRETELQSKGGLCNFKTYTQESVPLGVAAYLHLSRNECDRCHKQFGVAAAQSRISLITKAFKRKS
ncbi:hypothetical protein M0R72_07705 [Candidatus Pacearchaeota archaeon]|jgi:hypothetical protein|nr:hypothetical protein [Candidatus Pacearchaeota archaeon]